LFIFEVEKIKVYLNNDFEIWEAFKAGDKSALSYIYSQHFHSLFQYGIRFKDDPEFVKDCIQDVFYQLMKAGRHLSATDNIRFYLFRTLKNVTYKKFEKERKAQLSEILTFNASFSLEEEILEKENITNTEKALAGALNNLSSRQREIIYLRYECEMEYDQICEIMRLKNDSARKLVFRAIKALREIIEGHSATPVLFFFRFTPKYVF
jgi:RNA polymerase sigma factor (sigma-70 family)